MAWHPCPSQDSAAADVTRAASLHRRATTLVARDLLTRFGRRRAAAGRRPGPRGRAPRVARRRGLRAARRRRDPARCGSRPRGRSPARRRRGGPTSLLRGALVAQLVRLHVGRRRGRGPVRRRRAARCAASGATTTSSRCSIELDADERARLAAEVDAHDAVLDAPPPRAARAVVAALRGAPAVPLAGGGVVLRGLVDVALGEPGWRAGVRLPPRGDDLGRSRRATTPCSPTSRCSRRCERASSRCASPRSRPPTAPSSSTTSPPSCSPTASTRCCALVAPRTPR